MKSKLFQLNAKDLLKAVILALPTGAATYAALPAVTQAASDGSTEIAMNAVDALGSTPVAAAPASLAVTIITFALYLVKNFFTNSQDQFTKEPKV